MAITSTEQRNIRYRSIADELARRIRCGEYGLGTQLPVEHDLAAQFDTSRQTVREALRLLADKGLILRRPGHGTTVINSDERALFTVSLGTVSHLLSYPEGVARRHLDSGHCVADATLAAVLGCEPGTPWYRIRGLRFEQGKDVPLCWVDIYVLPRFAPLAKGRMAERLTIIEQVEKRFGEKVESAEVDISVGRVPQDIATQLQVGAGTPSLTVVRRYLGSAGEPLEITVSIHPENRYAYRMRLQKGKR